MCSRLSADRTSSTSPAHDGMRERIHLVAQELREAMDCPVAVCALLDSGHISWVERQRPEAEPPCAEGTLLEPEAVDAIMQERTIRLEGDLRAALACAHPVLVPLTGSDGRLAAVVLSEQPIDERTLALLAVLGRRVGAALAGERAVADIGAAEELNDRLRQIISTKTASSSDAIMAIDLDGRILRANEPAERLLGWRAEDVAGQVLPFVREDRRDLGVRVIRQIAAGHDARHPIEAIQRKDGTLIPVMSTSFPLVDRYGVTFAVAAILRPVREALAVPEVIARYSALIDQGLMGPVAAIKGYAQLLSRPEIDGDRARRERVLRNLSERSSSLVRTLDELLTVARLEVHDITPLRAEVDVSTLLSVVAEDLSQAKPDHDIQVDVDSRVPSASLDNGLMQTAIGGLVAHSASRCATGGRIVLSAEFDGDAGLCIHVTDDGPELSSSEAARMFERPDPAREHATAFGPYLAALAVRAHGGDASATPAPDGGGRFTLRLPV